MATSLSTAGPPSNTWFLGPIRVHSPNSKSIGSAVSAQLTEKVPILYNGRPFPQKLPILVRGWGLPSFSWFLEADWAHNPNCIMIGSAIFAQVTAECPYTLQWTPLSPKIAPSHGGSGPACKTRFLGLIRAHRPNAISIGSAVFSTDDRRMSLYFTMGRPFSPKNLRLPMGGSEPPSNTWSLGPTQVLNPNGISIGSAVFAGLTSVTDRQTDHATRSLTIDRIYVCTVASLWCGLKIELETEQETDIEREKNIKQCSCNRRLLMSSIHVPWVSPCLWLICGKTDCFVLVT